MGSAIETKPEKLAEEWASRILQSLVKDADEEKAKREKEKKDNAAKVGRILKFTNELSQAFKAVAEAMPAAGITRVTVDATGDLTFFDKKGKRVKAITVKAGE